MLAQESHNALPISASPILQGIVKMLRSYFFSGKVFCITALQVTVRLTILILSNLPLFTQYIFLMNFAD